MIKFECSNCAHITSRWEQKCQHCDHEGTLVKKEVPEIEAQNQPLLEGTGDIYLPVPFPNFNRIFNGGFLLPNLYYLFAEQFTGKTAFMLQAASYIVSLGFNVLYITNDESTDGIKAKCQIFNLGTALPVFIFDVHLNEIINLLRTCKPALVVVDSLQTLTGYTQSSSAPVVLQRLKKAAQYFHCAIVVIGEMLKDKTTFRGSGSIGNIADVMLEMRKGDNGEVVMSSPVKNRQTGDLTSRIVLRMKIPGGFQEVSEIETGNLPRHTNKAATGLTAFIAESGADFFVDEITAQYNKAAVLSETRINNSLIIEGGSSPMGKSLLTVLNSCRPFYEANYIVRANKSEKVSHAAELAILVAIFSQMENKSVPVDTVFMGRVNLAGELLPVDNMERRAARAKAQGYTRIIGPKVYGTQRAEWEEAANLEEVWQLLDD